MAKVLAGLMVFAIAGDRIDEIHWMSWKEAAQQAPVKGKERWILVYLEWPM
jgi:hypothetical protein